MAWQQITATTTLTAVSAFQGALAYVPYIEERDSPEGEIFEVINAVRSKSFCAYLHEDDVDVLVVGHRNGQPGDYIAAIGRAERFGLSNMKLLAVNTPIISSKEEMHSTCDDRSDSNTWFRSDTDPAPESGGPRP